MKFDYCIGNPPYHENGNNAKLYPYFYLAGQDISDCVEMIFPSIWQEYKTSNGLQLLNKKEIKEDEQIVFIDNRDDAFPNVPGAKDTNIIMWKKGYSNGLDGNQRVLCNGENEQIKHLVYTKAEIIKPTELVELKACVTSSPGFKPMSSAISVRKPYGFTTDIAEPKDKDGHPISLMEKYGLPDMHLCKESDSDMILICSNNNVRYLDSNYPVPRFSGNENKWKCFLPNAWGNLSKQYVGGAYADIMLAPPKYICSETYLETAGFDNKQTAFYSAKYLMTKFCRALLYVNKTSLLCSNAWDAVPVQDYSEDFWSGSISEINDALMDKYDVPQNIRDFVEKNIQTKTEDNIVNFKEVD